MSRGKKNNETAPLFQLIVLLIETIIVLIYRTIIFIYDLITYFTTQYKLKSGNGFFKMYFSKGNYGEFLLYRKVVKVFKKEFVLANLYLDNRNTDTTEIDILAVSNKGIFVFEMKNYSGYIYGNEKDVNWTQVLNKRTKNNFYNPLRQNYVHTKAVENYLGLSSDTIVPIVVFSNNSKLSKITISDKSNVFQFRKAMQFIRKIEHKGNQIFTNEQKKEFLVKLVEKSNMPEEIRQKHIEDVIKLQTNKH